MSLTAAAPTGRLQPVGDRFRLHRAGILNVWQYDDQEFLVADGRMLLRGANGAGKSKTLEMLLPFALDGDKARITASARHHTSLLWLMTDGYDGQARVGYIWVEFERHDHDGHRHTFTCGVGIRASASAKTASAWFFATDQVIGDDLLLEDDGGPLSHGRLKEAIGDRGEVFTSAPQYKEHVGQALFGLTVTQYDDVLRLLYWLRQPQVGEDIEPARLAGQLAHSLPELDEASIKAAGDMFDELTTYGEQIQRRTQAATALRTLALAYAGYARGSVAARGRALLEAGQDEQRLRKAVRHTARQRQELQQQRDHTDAALLAAERSGADDAARIEELSASPEADDQRRLADLTRQAKDDERRAADTRGDQEAARANHERRAHDLERSTDDLHRRLREQADTMRALDHQQRDLGVPDPLVTPAALAADLRGDGRPDEVTSALGLARGELTDARGAVGRKQAAVRVLHEALRTLGNARRLLSRREEEVAVAEQRWEQARARRINADEQAETLGAELTDRLRAWADEEVAPVVDVDISLTPEVLETLPDRARRAAAEPLAALHADRQSAATARETAATRIAELDTQRAAIEAERDPSPPSPTLPRTARPDGAPLWLLVDFAPDVTDEQRAGYEAALQASGLLDAWVRPDGRLLDPEQRDTLLEPGGSAVADRPCLAEVLRPNLPDGTDVTDDVVAAVLRRIGIGDASAAAAAEGPTVGADGAWHLAPLRGRAGKERAQFIGATARAQERSRRLAEIDDVLARERHAEQVASARLVELTAAIDALEGWVHRLPSASALQTAWARVDERRERERAEEGASAAATQAAHDAREQVVAAQAAADEVARSHDLPTDSTQLDALAERLRGLDHDLQRATDQVPSLLRDLDRWTRDLATVKDAESALTAARERAGAAGAAAQETAARLDALRSRAGLAVQQLERRLAQLRASVQGAREEARGHRESLSGLDRQIGGAEGAVQRAHDDLAEHASVRHDALEGVASLADVPGLISSAFEVDDAGRRTPEALEAGAPGALTMSDLTAMRALAADAPIPPAVHDLAQRLAGRATDGDATDVTVWRAYNEARSGPAADHEPAVSEFGVLLTVSGRDDAGQSPIGELAARVSTAVEHDRELLTAREREQFERHVLGELGDAIRRCRVEADELVAAMNELLAGVTTSQGIRVRLDWRLRDDVPPEVREAIDLLVQPVGALLPEERAALRDCLHRLIEASRAEHPERSYGEHLAEALDYRGWFAFRIRYTRPESNGAWLDLHRRSPLSQGEQKVLCYLPLFAAAAAHFTSLAGAAPHAPRLVLLDDAFPKIDVRTHPLLFGLLVQLDLDFVVTSERLWGDHETVPTLSIYEALRDPGQRGIAQYYYRWDGRQLHSVG
ncbi:TIGR02680 family protein [Leekyejoonella antrihumi]|uniref:TIGR02680 family protein n=1 Tax=Leekyejoonella antrihumi TaxID=1660198 RepID=A0A563E8L3_9MICO|nr:TIGR02680 family protein [Leekyejoonella antrihumi]TWP38552.1 TIGR02680 family protein [Leekyejoonella antrihumi]